MYYAPNLSWFFSVLYFSIHRYDHGTFWPEEKYSDFDFVGKEEGEGFNVNVAWNKVLLLL